VQSRLPVRWDFREGPPSEQLVVRRESPVGQARGRERRVVPIITVPEGPDRKVKGGRVNDPSQWGGKKLGGTFPRMMVEELVAPGLDRRPIPRNARPDLTPRHGFPYP